MGSSYNFRNKMKLKSSFRNVRVAGTNDDHYCLPKNKFFLHAWERFRKRYREDFQRDIFRAMAVAGIILADWERVFVNAVDAKPPFQDLDRKVYKGEICSPFEFFVQKLAREGKWRIHYPPLCPEWLFPYKYSQQDYLCDLETYWEDVDNAYYRPWGMRCIGEDSPEVARIKWLGEVAREEIDEVARQTGLYLKR